MIYLLTYKGKRVSGPKELIDYFYNTATMKTAIILILVFLLLEFISFIAVGLPSITNILFTIYSKVLVGWLLLAFVFYLLTYFIRGKKNVVNNLYSRILILLSSFKLPIIIFSVFYYLVFFVFLNNFLPSIRAVILNPTLINSTTLFPAITTGNMIGFFLIGIIYLAIVVYVIIMFYYFIKQLLNTKGFWPTVLFMFIYGVIGFLLTLIF